MGAQPALQPVALEDPGQPEAQPGGARTDADVLAGLDRAAAGRAVDARGPGRAGAAAAAGPARGSRAQASGPARSPAPGVPGRAGPARPGPGAARAGLPAL